MLSRRLCWKEGYAIAGEQFSQYSEVGWKETECENAEDKGQECEIPEAKRSIGQDTVLFWS